MLTAPMTGALTASAPAPTAITGEPARGQRNIDPGTWLNLNSPKFFHLGRNIRTGFEISQELVELFHFVNGFLRLF
jgi:hypothetical protein